MIIHNLVAPFDQSTFANMAGFVNASDGKSYTLLHKLAGTFFISIPVATGYPNVCPANALPILGTMDAACTVLQSCWSLGYLLLWTLACWKAVHKILQERKNPDSASRESRQWQILEYSRLMILLSCGLTILIYAPSMSAASAPMLAARYLVCLLLSIPVILWPLWPHKLQFRTIPGGMLFLSRICLFLLIFCMFLSGIVEAFADITTAQQFSVHQANLIQRLQTLKATHIYSEYWTCNRLIFQSNEKIMCSVLNEDLTPGMNRYPPYHLAVKKASRPAYVFPYRSKHDLNFIKQQTQTNQLQKYRYIKYENYSLYIPRTGSACRCDLPTHEQAVPAALVANRFR
ncbi:hypothetical protein KDW_60470 [Dictyobacter vulcani]|uniref:Uncharacterized protein n=1 Tax=Dictyobacter vulcani TaxID=2607529 RepID=A0A5J4KVA4_9CHLR|nr:hypothetical protein KDW_60470 [Dictyobacter vulcani]